MKKRVPQALLAGALILTGVVVAQLLPRAEAQPPARQWRECFAATLWRHDGAHMAGPNFRPRTVSVPAGWVPVGGTSSEYAVVLCR